MRRSSAAVRTATGMVGNVETETGGRQVFGAVAKTDTDVKVLIRRSLDAVGRTEDTMPTAFTDGCSQTAGGLSDDDPARVAAKAVIVEEVERLHWRLWNGKAKDAQISIEVAR